MTGPNAGVTPRRPVFNVGVRLHPIELVGWHSLKLVRMGEIGDTASIWERGAAWVRVSVAELPGEEDALGRLKATLDHVMRPDIPSVEQLGREVGDVGYAVVDDAGVGGAVWFVRGNCCVAVSRANDEPADTFEVAAAIDSSLVEPPTGQPRRTEALGAEPVVVVTSLAELTGRRLHITAPTGRIVAESDAVLYYPTVDDSVAETTRPVSVTITIGE